MTGTEAFAQDDEIVLAAEQVLGLLSGEAADEWARRRSGDPALRQEQSLWAAAFAELALAVPEEHPPPGILPAAEARLFPEDRQSLLRRLGVLPALAGGFAAAAILLAATNLGWLAPPGGGERSAVAMLQSEDGVSLPLLWMSDPARLMAGPLTGDLPAGQVAQLWLVSEGMARPLAIFARGDSAVLDVEAGAVTSGAEFRLTAEFPGGSSGDAPSERVLATGRLEVVE